MNKHTPGPWSWYGNPNGGARVQTASVGIANVLSRAGVAYPPQASCEANARLISAAPDLYEAAVAMLEAEPYLASDESHLAREKLRAAVAKANGQ